MEPIEFTLLPDTAAVAADGSLTIGGCSVARPRRRVRHAGCSSTTRPPPRAAAARRSPRSAPGASIYATKAFLCRAMARLAYEEGMLLDVASGGELHVALAAGVPAVGVHDARQQQERRRAAHGDRRRRAPHRRRQLRRARPPRRARTPTAPAGARRAAAHHARACTPTPTSTSPPARTTRSSASTSANGDAAARRRAGAALGVGATSSGCTATSARTCSPPTSFAQGGRGDGRASPRRSTCPSSCSAAGSASPTSRARRRRRSREWADVVLDACRRARRAARRSASSRAGRSSPPRRSPSTRSARSSDIPGVRTYVAVDGGMSDNPRPGALRQRLRGVPARGRSTPSGRCRARVVGKHCESGDVLLFDAHAARRRRRRRPAGHAGHRRLRPLDGLELQQGARARRSCSSRDGDGAARRAPRDVRRPARHRRRLTPRFPADRRSGILGVLRA